MNKLAQVTLSFWIMKICATTPGETTSDLLTRLVAKGGLDFGTMGSSPVLASILLIAIACTAMRDARMARQRNRDRAEGTRRLPPALPQFFRASPLQSARDAFSGTLQ